MGEREAQVRPDMIIRIPGGVVVRGDSKAPLGRLSRRCPSDLRGPTERVPCAVMPGHVRGHVTKLAAKSYEKQFGSARRS